MRTGSARCASVSFSVVVSMVTAGVSSPNRSSIGAKQSGGLRGLYRLVAENWSRGLAMPKEKRVQHNATRQADTASLKLLAKLEIAVRYISSRGDIRCTFPRKLHTQHHARLGKLDTQ